MLHGIVKGTFAIVGITLLTMLIYQLLYVGSGSALMVAGKAVEYPMAVGYYDMVITPALHEGDELAASLGINNIYEPSSTTYFYASSRKQDYFAQGTIDSMRDTRPNVKLYD